MSNTITHHIVVINPPSPHRNTWQAICSQSDFTKSYRNRAEAMHDAYGHIDAVTLAHSLASGTYEFDDGEI